MDVCVDAHSPVAPFQQVVSAVLDAIAGGEFEPGERLPSVRELALQVLVNPNTVARAYRVLQRQGVARARRGAGVFVTDAGPELARAARSAATLEHYHQAAREALRCGHDLAALSGLLHELSARPAGAHGGRQ